MNNLLADFVVRLNTAKKKNVEYFYVPYSNLIVKVVRLLFMYRCIKTFSIDTSPNTGKLRIKVVLLCLLNKPLIQSLQLISRPGLRIY